MNAPPGQDLAYRLFTRQAPNLGGAQINYEQGLNTEDEFHVL